MTVDADILFDWLDGSCAESYCVRGVGSSKACDNLQLLLKLVGEVVSEMCTAVAVDML